MELQFLPKIMIARIIQGLKQFEMRRTGYMFFKFKKIYKLVIIIYRKTINYPKYLQKCGNKTTKFGQVMNK